MKRFVILLILIFFLVSSSGCGELLDRHVEVIEPHEVTPYIRPPAEETVISVTGLDELRNILIELIAIQETETVIHYQSAGNVDVQAEVLRIRDELIGEDIITAYAVSNITAEATRIVTYYEINVNIEYKRTLEQVSSIMTVSTQRYLTTQLLDVMSQYREEALILTSMELEQEDIIALVTEVYYQNPRRIVMMPFVTIRLDTEVDGNRIYEIRFGYTEDRDMQRQYGSSLELSVRQNALRAVGDTDARILLSLTENLIASAVYDEGTAGTISMHGPQNFAATAFGALVRGNAVGEGFAMAFKALCDELRFDCRIVLGNMGDVVHAWNIVFLEGDYYHIDVAKCASEGLEASFLKTDEDFFDLYEWDTENTPQCNGLLTLIDILPPPPPEDDTLNGEDDIIDGNGGENGGENGGNNDTAGSEGNNGDDDENTGEDNGNEE